MIEKNRKRIFISILVISFLMILIYNFLTPILSDDFFYKMSVKDASSLWDLFKLQYAEYCSNNARFFGQLNLRIFLIPDKWIFNIVNSLMFILLVGLIYINVNKRKLYDIALLLFIIVFLWRYTVAFGQTMLWLCGSTNYLWGTVIILGFVTFYRHLLKNDSGVRMPFKGYEYLLPVFVFLFGVYAGICNENTSGGGLLLVLIFNLNSLLSKPKEDRKIKPYMISAVLGMCTGLGLLVSAPGVRSRAATMSVDENYSGILKYVSHLYKLTVVIKELYFELLVIIAISVVVMVIKKKICTFEQIRKHETFIFLFASIATSYALVLAPTPQNRAFFGAGVFMMISALNGLLEIKDEEFITKTAFYSLETVLILWLFFTYFINLVNLQRIQREENERVSLIVEAAQRGEEEVVVPQYRPAFKNDYTIAYDSDMIEDADYWVNHFYEEYFGVDSVSAIPRDEWNELYGE